MTRCAWHARWPRHPLDAACCCDDDVPYGIDPLTGDAVPPDESDEGSRCSDSRPGGGAA